MRHISRRVFIGTAIMTSMAVEVGAPAKNPCWRLTAWPCFPLWFFGAGTFSTAATTRLLSGLAVLRPGLVGSPRPPMKVSSASRKPCSGRDRNTEFGERRQQLPFPADRATPGIREQQLRARLQSWLANVNKVRGYAETARLRGYRNKILAHATAWPSLRPTRLPNYGDEQKLLDLTIPVVSEGYRLVTGIHYDFSAAKSVWGLAQRDMWEIARSGTRGERYSPSSRNMADLARELKGAGSITIRG